MTAYLIGLMTIRDARSYGEYKLQTPEIVTKYKGKFLSRGGRKHTFEGGIFEERVVLVEFPDIECAKSFYHSKEYAIARKKREGAAEMLLFAVEGFEN